MAVSIAVYADWAGLVQSLRLGWLYARCGAGREISEFAFEAAALAHRAMRQIHLDPRLGLFEGRQHPPARPHDLQRVRQVASLCSSRNRKDYS